MKPIEDYPEDVFDKVIAVNVKGIWLGAKYVLPQMNDGGSMILTSSVAGVNGSPNVSAYITSKHAVVGIMRATAIEASPRKIRVNSVHPKYVTMQSQKQIQAENENSRRQFIRQSTMLSAGVVLAGGSTLFARDAAKPAQNIRTRGYAAHDRSAVFAPWEFERRPVGDNDILIDIKYCGVCHSDIHTARSDWRPAHYPLVPGHEIAGVVAAVGPKVTEFKVGDHAGVGCMVNSCMHCENCDNGLEQYCNNHVMVSTYGQPDQASPGGYTQGGYSTCIVVRDHFAIHIPRSLDLKEAAPLLCAGITTYSPLMHAKIVDGMKVGVAGIGGLGHMAVKLAVSKGADVYAFTTSPSKVGDIKKMGAKDVIVVDDLGKLMPYCGKLDYMIATIPAKYDIGAYTSLVKPYGHYTQVGLPAGELSFNNFSFVANRVNFNGSLIGGIPETQEVINYCALNNIVPDIQVINAKELTEVYAKVVNKEARYRYVIDIATI